MNKWDVRLISASYTVDVDGVVIELFGKTRDKKSITVLVYGFKPYFFIVDPTHDIELDLSKDPEVLSIAHDVLLYKSKNHDVLRITIKSPWKVPEYRSILRKKGYDILAADIPFHHRYMYDVDMGSCICVTGDTIDKRRYSTDIVIKLNSFKNIDPFDPELKILSFDIENSINNDIIYTICQVISYNNDMKQCKPIIGDEREIITIFSKLINDEDPDIITGYNINNYDIRKIIDRAKANGIQDVLSWGRDGGQPRAVSERFWRLKGRLICDAWWATRKELHPKQETLNAVAFQILGEHKIDVNPKHIDSEWVNNKDKVLRYCTKDAEIALRILIEIGTIRKSMDLAFVSKLTIEDVITSGSSQLVDSLLIRSADKNKIAVPMMGHSSTYGRIEGGYVHTMTPGLYHWVCVLDFKSMYPSLIISKNICFTTLSDDGEIISPSGVKFMSKDKRPGLIPIILKDLMHERDQIKHTMKNTYDEKERHYLDGLQSAIKILMNTFYGVLASSFYRFTDKAIGAAITSFAREKITRIISDVEEEGISVVYSDTDSIFILSPEHSIDGSIKFGISMQNRFSKDGGTLELEKILEPLFTHGKKKRYVGRVVWPDMLDDLLIRGYETRRSDSFNLQVRLLSSVFDNILSGKNDKALELIHSTINDVQHGRVNLKDLVISRTCKDTNEYQNPKSMANVQAAKKLIKMGYNFIPGMKVSWIVTDGKSTPQNIEPYINDIEFTLKPDYKYYVERLAHTVSRITEVFGFTEEDLIIGNKQSTLFSGASSMTRDSHKKRRGKVLGYNMNNKSLEDFL